MEINIPKGDNAQWFPEKLQLPARNRKASDHPEPMDPSDEIVTGRSKDEAPLLPVRLPSSHTMNENEALAEEQEAPSGGMAGKWLKNSMVGLFLGLTLLGTTGCNIGERPEPPPDVPSLEEVLEVVKSVNVGDFISDSELQKKGLGTITRLYEVAQKYQGNFYANTGRGPSDKPISVQQAFTSLLSGKGFYFKGSASSKPVEIDIRVLKEVMSFDEWWGSVDDLSSSQNRLLHPKGNQKSPQTSKDKGSLTVTSWNIHHGRGPNGNGQPLQINEIIRQMRKTGSDIYLLQEVPPGYAQFITDRMGMEGYYTRTLPAQGDMMLVNPEIKVERNEKIIVNGNITPGNEGSALSSILEWSIAGIKNDGEMSQRAEPRAAQILKVSVPGGKSVYIWNTHLTSIRDQKLREKETEKIIDYLAKVSRGSDTIIGGGDLNSSITESPIEELQKNGYEVKGAKIDWITTKNLEGSIETSSEKLYEKNGIQISDHPIVVGKIELQK